MTLDIDSATKLGLAIGTLLVVAYNTFQSQRIRVRVRNVSDQQEEVREELAQKTVADDKKLAVLHALANSAMAMQKKMAAELAEEVARLTGTAAHVLRAQNLRTLFDDHMRKQQAADELDPPQI